MKSIIHNGYLVGLSHNPKDGLVPPEIAREHAGKLPGMLSHIHEQSPGNCYVTLTHPALSRTVVSSVGIATRSDIAQWRDMRGDRLLRDGDRQIQSERHLEPLVRLRRWFHEHTEHIRQIPHPDVSHWQKTGANLMDYVLGFSGESVSRQIAVYEACKPAVMRWFCDHGIPFTK